VRYRGLVAKPPKSALTPRLELPPMKICCLFLVALLAGSTCSAADLASLHGKAVFASPGNTARSYQRTTRGDWATGNFVAEVTVTLRGGGGAGCAFFGLGRGEANPAMFHEPSVPPAVMFRMAPSDFCGGQIEAFVNATALDSATLGDGTHRLRLWWNAARKSAWLEVQPHWTAGAAFTPRLSLFAPAEALQFGQDGHLFVGGAAGVTFADFSVRGATEAEFQRLPRSDSFSRDPSAGTWLPVNGASALPPGDGITKAVDTFLAGQGVTFRPMVCWYKGANLEASRSPRDGKLRLPNSQWACSVDAKAVPGASDARDLTLRVTLREGGASSAGIAAALDFTEWDTGNYVLIPASVYNGNRNRIVSRGYCSGLDPRDYYRKDLPLTHADVPHLAKEKGTASKLEVNSSNAATPAVCIFDRRHSRGFILLAEQAGRDGSGDFLRRADGEILDNAFAVEESADRARATVIVAAPGVRSKKPEFMGFSGSLDRGVALKAGDKITLTLRLYSFAAADVPAVLDKFMSVRKALTGPNHPRNLLPASESLKWLAARIDNRWQVHPQVSFYGCENGNWLTTGWVAGLMNTFPMLALGDEPHRQRVAKTFDFGIKAQRKTGYLWYSIFPDEQCHRFPFSADYCMARMSGDTLYWMLKQFALLKAQGHNKVIKPAWEDAMRKLADGLVATWKKHGQWGKLIHVETGDVVEYNTTGGAMCIGGLALASQYFNNPEYLAVAKQAADFYYQRDFVKLGQTTGACADILQNADSETAFAFTTALAALHDVTGDKAWLEKSRNLANLAATWTASYDYELPKFTALGKIGTRLAGAVWASTQNKHAAPGYCTGSGDALVKIYRMTGSPRYAELIRDIKRAHDEAFHGGGGTERLTYCDADSRGDNAPGSNGWTECNGAMMDVEIPGIYLRTDIDRFYVFDAVEAKVVARDASGVQLEIHNPTKFAARVAIFAETAAKAQKPQGFVAFVHWPKVLVHAGATVRVHVARDGTL
jgi:hypothetical protein